MVYNVHDTARSSSVVLHTELPDDNDLDGKRDSNSFLYEQLVARKRLIMAAAGLLVVGVSIAVIASTTSSSDEASLTSGIAQTVATTTTTVAPAKAAEVASTYDGETSVGSNGVDNSVLTEVLPLPSNFTFVNSTNSSADYAIVLTPERTSTTKFDNTTVVHSIESATASTTTDPPTTTTTDPPTTTTSTPPPTPAPTSPPTDPPTAAPTPAPTPPPTTSPSAPRYPYKDTKFDWLNIKEWQGDNDKDPSFASGGFQHDKIEVSTFGKPFNKSPVLRTKRGWSGEKILFVEWITYFGSDTNIWLLPTSLSSQFGDSRWPNCGEYDIYEMFNGDAAIGHSGTQNFFYGGGLDTFGQSTTHIASTHCFAPFFVQQPSVGSQAAQWPVRYHNKISMAVVFGRDGNGLFIQQILDPTIVDGADGTADIQGGTPADKMYNNANTYWGVKPEGACAAGHDPNGGYPFFGEFRLVFQEQFHGKFDITNIRVLAK